MMAAAEGAVHAYADVTGDEWKPYEAPMATTSTERKSTATMMAALAD